MRQIKSKVKTEVGKRAWVAKVTGTDTQWGFKREFLQPQELRGLFHWQIKESGLYQYTIQQNRLKSGFVFIDTNGKFDLLSEKEALYAVEYSQSKPLGGQNGKE